MEVESKVNNLQEKSAEQDQVGQNPDSQDKHDEPQKKKSSRPCLICYNSFKPSSNRRKSLAKKTISNEEAKANKVSTDQSASEKALKEVDLLEDRLGIMFIVRKLLRLPESIIVELLSAHGDPSNWGETCCMYCNAIVEDAEEVAEKIFNYQNKLKCLQERVKDEILISAQDKSGCAVDIEKSLSIAVIDDIRFKFVQKSAIDGVRISENAISLRDSREKVVAPYSPLSISDLDDFIPPPTPAPVTRKQTRNVNAFGIVPDALVKEEQQASEDEWDEDLPDAYLNPEVEWDLESSEGDEDNNKKWDDDEEDDSESEPASEEDEWRPSRSSGKYAKTEQKTRKRKSRRRAPPSKKKPKPPPRRVYKSESSDEGNVEQSETDKSKYQFKCTECIQSFPSEHFRDAHHRRRHLGIKRCYICQFCGRGYERNQSLVAHGKFCTEENPKPKRSKSNGSQSEDSEEEKESKLLTARRAERKYRFKCPQCPQHFPSEHFRDAHNRRRHLGIKLCFICDKCGKAYDRNQSLEVHKKNCFGDGTFIHPVDPRLQEVPKFKCSKCPRHFPSELSRDAHEKRYHEGLDKPFECECKHAFKHQRQLFEHQRKYCSIVKRDPEDDKSFKKQNRNKSVAKTEEKSFDDDNDYFNPFYNDGDDNGDDNENAAEDSQENVEQKRVRQTRKRKTVIKNAASDGEDESDDDDSDSDFNGEEGENSDDEGRKRKGRKTSKEGTTTGRKRRPNLRYKCSVEDCDASFYSKVVRDGHIRGIHEGMEEPFQCLECDKKFAKYDALKYHRKLHKTKCDDCGEEFETGKILEKHRKEAHGAHQDVICELCGSSFEKEKDLTHHKHAKHYVELNLDPYKCEPCDKMFATPRILELHNMSFHPDPSTFKHFCKICNKGFVIKTFLVKHMGSHGVKAVYCEVCGVGLVNASLLTRHMRIHTGEKPFSCDECGKSFQDEYKLNRHKLVHSEPQLVCDVCGKKFRQAGNLRLHLRVHDPTRVVKTSRWMNKYTENIVSDEKIKRPRPCKFGPKNKRQRVSTGRPPGRPRKQLGHEMMETSASASECSLDVEVSGSGGGYDMTGMNLQMPGTSNQQHHYQVQRSQQMQNNQVYVANNEAGLTTLGHHNSGTHSPNVNVGGSGRPVWEQLALGASLIQQSQQHQSWFQNH